MTLPRDLLAARALEWIAFADDDLRLAQHTLSLSPRCPFRLAAYHAQQCAEKCFKAYLVWRGIDFPHTHNIARLRKLCVDVASWAAGLRDADELSTFAMTARYPGQEMTVTESDALMSVRIADAVRETVRRVLRDEGLEP